MNWLFHEVLLWISVVTRFFLWYFVAQSFSGKGHYVKRIRYHGKGCFGIMDKVKCHYFVRLVEGPPPPSAPAKTGFDQAKEYIEQLRNRTIINTLWQLSQNSVSVFPFWLKNVNKVHFINKFLFLKTVILHTLVFRKGAFANGKLLELEWWSENKGFFCTG